MLLAIETSCDDTSVALLDEGGVVRGLISQNQDSSHGTFGGIVPEIAGRDHSARLLPEIDQLLKKCSLSLNTISAVAVTSEPGLLGSLLVGVITAKALAISLGVPLISVNHLEGHLFAGFLKDDLYSPPQDFGFPFLALTVSGGHTSLIEVQDVGKYKVIGETLDDAAGEAFDKFAKMVGLGFPGGQKVDELAKSGRPSAYSFPRGLKSSDDFNFSFSGLKSAAFRELQARSPEEIKARLNDYCASYQESIVDSLIEKLSLASKKLGHSRVVVTGGVSANSRLRVRSEEWAKKEGVRLLVPPLRYCTDNAAMIGWVGLQKLKRGEIADHTLAPSPHSRIEFEN